jgi:glycogen operon protein
VGWAEWNDKYRDTVRHFWRGDRGHVPELASRLSGSSDIYAWSDRRAYASINFVTAHDGYTLRDLVSYERKHNEANGEGNRDGHENNISRNWGAEGDTDDPAVTQVRLRAMRGLLATLAFSQGVPMLAHGDELGRTQRGNNNAYAQDNETTWVSWKLAPWQQSLLGFTRRLFAIRHANPVLRRRSFFHGRPVGKAGAKDLTWIGHDGRELSEADWHAPHLATIGMLISGDAADESDDRGRPVRGDTMLLLLNASTAPVRFALPAVHGEGSWTLLVDTAEGENPPAALAHENAHTVAPFTVALLRHGANRRLGLRGYTPRGGETVHAGSAVDALDDDGSPAFWSTS